MANSLETILRNGPNVMANTTPMFKLPNNGGSYANPAAPAPIFGGTNPTVTPPPAVTPPAYTPPPTPVATPPVRSKYMNPETGKYFTPQEYANYVAMKIPVSKGNGDIPQYAGDAMTRPDESSSALTTRATNLNNTRNDIATGTTDPYKVGAKSGIAYSPTELAAIEKAYAGVYDPALNDVFARLKDRKATEDAKQKQADQIFQTNEAIRQWKATTGTGPTYTGKTTTQFTKTQLNKGAVNAGMSIESFDTLDDDMKNFYINNPTETDPLTGKKFALKDTFTNLIKMVEEGTATIEDATADIMDSELPDTVKAYYIGLLPISDVEKKGFWAQIFGAIGSLFSE
jgi:hypothetical protein